MSSPRPYWLAFCRSLVTRPVGRFTVNPGLDLTDTLGMTNTVGILKSKHGHTLAVFADAAEAQRKCDEYNANPQIEPGTDSPDYDAPYSVEVWTVRQ